MKWLWAALLVVALAVSHVAAYRLGAWIHSPRVSTALAEAVVGERAPALVEPLALMFRATARWWSANHGCASQLRELAQINEKQAQKFKLVTQRARELVSQARAQAEMIEAQAARVYVAWEILREEKCKSWADEPVCPAVADLRTQ